MRPIFGEETYQGSFTFTETSRLLLVRTSVSIVLCLVLSHRATIYGDSRAGDELGF